MTQCQYHPNDRHEETDHGCFAVVGDFVEVLNPMGQRSGVHGLVQSVEIVKAIAPKRIFTILYSNRPGTGRVKDSYIRIISRS
jgi:hypothetical protein